MSGCSCAPSSTSQCCPEALLDATANLSSNRTRPGPSMDSSVSEASTIRLTRRPSARWLTTRETNSRSSALKELDAPLRCRARYPQHAPSATSAARRSSSRPSGWKTSRQRALRDRSPPVAPRRDPTGDVRRASSANLLKSSSEYSISKKRGAASAGRPSPTFPVIISVAGSAVGKHHASAGTTCCISFITSRRKVVESSPA